MHRQCAVYRNNGAVSHNISGSMLHLAFTPKAGKILQSAETGCPDCRRDPRHEGRRQAPGIQPGFQVANDYGDLPIQGPALEYHQEGNPVLPVQLKLGFT